MQLCCDLLLSCIKFSLGSALNFLCHSRRAPLACLQCRNRGHTAKTVNRGGNPLKGPLATCTEVLTMAQQMLGGMRAASQAISVNVA